MARCPAHDDSRASLSVAAGDKHPVVLHCQAGCQPDAILAALGLDFTDLSSPKRIDEDWTPCGHGTAAEYRYVDEQGTHLFTVVRCPRKDFAQWRPDPVAKTGRRWKLGDVRRVLYRLPAVLAAVAEQKVIHIVEGEKDVHTLEAHGLVATCNPHGAGKWKDEYAQHLRGAVVTIVADRDPAGQAHAETVRDSLHSAGCDVTIVEPASGKDATDHVAAGHSLADLVQTWPVEQPIPHRPTELDEFLAQPEPEYEWLMPGLIERGDRMILTAEEGQGKSTLLRQIAVQAASGIHPFGGDDFEPLTVLWLQLENSRRHERREFRTLRLAAGGRYHGRLHVEIRSEGIDLLDGEQGQWLLNLVLAAKPDMLVTGPIYKLANGDPTEERTAKTTSVWLDRIRVEIGCAILLEAHVPYAASGRNRPERPYGASLWSRWPEFGLFLARDGMVRHWRGQRDERDWPAALQRGGAWPWTVVTQPDEVRWARIVELCREAGGQLRERDLAQLLGCAPVTVHRTIDKHRNDWDEIASPQVTGDGAE